MKKKLFALMMVGALSMSMTCAMSVYADEETTEEATEEEATDEESSEVAELTLDMIDEDVYEGTWLTFVEEFDLYLPSDWTVDVNTLEPGDDYIVFQATAEDASMSVAVTMTPAEDVEGYDLETAAEELAATDGYSGVQLVDINGISVVGYDTTTEAGNDLSGMLLFGEDGTMYTVTLGPVTDDTYSIATNIICSLSYPETEEETETDTEAVEE